VDDDGGGLAELVGDFPVGDGEVPAADASAGLAVDEEEKVDPFLLRLGTIHAI
jgi:hypothetical protein